METLITYFLKVNGLLIGFYLVYFLFLKKETFFNWSRWYFLLGIVLSLVVPLLTYTKIIWVAPTPMPELPDFIPFQQVETPVIIKESIDWNTIGFLFYGLVILILVGKMLVELSKLLVFLVKNKKTKVGSYFLIEQTSGQPFSFFNYVVFQKKNYTEAEIAAILQHEAVHVRQKHSIDVLFSQLFCCVFWVNPVCWWYKKAMQQNLEYIADAQTVAQTDSFIYQNLIVKATCSGSQLALTNPFYQSLIKKRILMINTTPSSKRNLWKYAVALPLLTAFFLMFQIETVAQVKDEKAVLVAVDYHHVLTSTSSDKEIRELEKAFTNENQKLQISKVKRNSNGEIIKIKLTFDTGKTYNQVKEVLGDTPITPIRIFIREDENGSREIGFEDVKDKVIVGNYNTTNEKGEIATGDQHYTIDKMVKNGKRMQLIIDGKLQKEGTKIGIPWDREIEIEREITALQAKQKYNIDAKEGEMFYEITTKPETVKSEKDAVYTVAVAEYSENESYNHIEKIKQNKLVDAKKALILFNGKEISYKDLDKIDVKSISSSGNMVSSHSMKKYGDKGKNGVIFINTKDYDISHEKMITEMAEVITEKKERERKAREQSNLSDEEIEKRISGRKELLEERKEQLEERKRNASKSGWGISYHIGEPNPEKLIEDATKSSSLDYKKAILVLNGKVIDSKELNSIYMTSIGKIEAKVANPELISQYGEKAKNGVIIIETTKYSKPTVSTDKLPEFKLKDGESFTISKRSSEEDLDFYKQTLQKSDCKVRFSNIKRNNKKEITSITIVLEKNGTESKKKINQSNAIDPIQIGVSNNKPFIKLSCPKKG